MIFADCCPDTSMTTKDPAFSHTSIFAKWLLNKGSFIPKQHKVSRKLNSFQRDRHWPNAAPFISVETG